MQLPFTNMKKATILAFALFAGAALGGALFIGDSMSVGAQTTSLSCSPASTMVAPGQSVTLSASGGNGTYQWSSPGLTITNPFGANFAVTFNRDGTFPVTVTSAGTTATCSVLVTGTAVPSTSTAPVTTPGLPNTGALPE